MFEVFSFSTPVRRILTRRKQRKGPLGAGGKAIVVADNEVAKTVVLGLVNQIGFDGIDAGGLGDSWRQQPGTPAYCTDLDAEDLLRALALAEKKRRPEWRASASRNRKLSKPA